MNHDAPFGAQLLATGGVCFRLWAPAQEQISVAIVGRGATLPMQATQHGWHELIDEQARAGDRYQFVLVDGLRVPDPASRYQPEDVHGPSEVIDAHDYPWHDTSWRGRPWHEAIIYELHVGTFTAQGTWQAAVEKLDYLVSLGITVIELMPSAEFPGKRGWGYDGVLLFAPESSYGRPNDLKYFIDQAHARELMVLLDVVYNHFGPEGNYLMQYAPQFFNAQHLTPWGAALNFAGDGAQVVRLFYISNALYWLREFHFDGLRLDAVHAIVDDSPEQGEEHILDAVARQVRATIKDRHIHLVLENEHNQARFLCSEAGPNAHAKFDAQWNDDVHHVLHTAITKERQGYYADYHGDTDKLARALAEGFVYQGETMHFTGSARGEACAHLAPWRFIAFLQNHDQVGNRPGGERIAALTPRQALRVATALYLLLPQVPMLFMGEEWASRQPFPFFCDFNEPLAQAVRDGRQRELARTVEHLELKPQFIDPLAEATFMAAKLEWAQRTTSTGAAHELLYRSLLRVRKTEIMPLLKELTQAGRARVIADGAVEIIWSGTTNVLRLLANLSDYSIIDATFAESSESHAARCIWQEGKVSAGKMDAWSMAYYVSRA